MLFERVSHKAVTTIYPPVAQAVFWTSHADCSSDSLAGLKFILVLFDVGVILCVVGILNALGRNPLGVIFYALESARHEGIRQLRALRFRPDILHGSGRLSRREIEIPDHFRSGPRGRHVGQILLDPARPHSAGGKSVSRKMGRRFFRVRRSRRDLLCPGRGRIHPPLDLWEQRGTRARVLRPKSLQCSLGIQRGPLRHLSKSASLFHPRKFSPPFC